MSIDKSKLPPVLREFITKMGQAGMTVEIHPAAEADLAKLGLNSNQGTGQKTSETSSPGLNDMPAGENCDCPACTIARGLQQATAVDQIMRAVINVVSPLQSVVSQLILNDRANSARIEELTQRLDGLTSEKTKH